MQFCFLFGEGRLSKAPSLREEENGCSTASSSGPYSDLFGMSNFSTVLKTKPECCFGALWAWRSGFLELVKVVSQGALPRAW